MNERLYKALNEDGTPCHGGIGAWNLPVKREGDWIPGKWMPPISGELAPCKNGYHLCRVGDLKDWLGPAIFEAECRGEQINANDKVVVSEARLLRQLTNWNDRTARLFACDCAERVLHIADDERCNNIIEITRRYANGMATDNELAAARDAVWDATWYATWAAVRSAAWYAANEAAWAAASYAASYAANEAANEAARDAASCAANDAAWAAAWGAAWGAAKYAERQWQQQRLMEYLYPGEDKRPHYC